MKTLYEIIKALQSTQGTKAKQAILDENKDNELLREYMKAVFDPSINYYQARLPKFTPTALGYDFTRAAISHLIDNLANRAVTGKAATKLLGDMLSTLTEDGRELVGYIIKRKIADANVGETAVLKTWPGLFFIPPYQRCASMSDKIKAKFSKLPYFFVQTKSDGQFSYLIKEAGKPPESMSRAGSLYPSWLPEKLAEGLPDGFVLAGEMLVYENEVMLNRQTGNGILNSVLSGDGSKFNPATMEVKYVAWDMLTVEEFDASYSSRSYIYRLDALEYMLREREPKCVSLVSNWKVSSIAEAMKIQNEHLARKEEGTVWKDPNLLWRDCSSGDPMIVKAKLVFEADYKITGAYEGKDKFVGVLGGFNVESADGLIRFNVGSGFSDSRRKEYWDMLMEHGMDCFNGTVTTVEGNDIVSSEGKDTESIFLPIFIELRLDKKEADSRERVWEQFNAARGL